MKLLIYGGCHAEILKRIILRYGEGIKNVSIVTNFKIIAKKSPFPLNRLDGVDLVIFNPIHRDDEYNTRNLERELESRSIRYIKYPWLQWSGYWPNARRRYWGTDSEWGMPLLDALANSSKDFEEFSRKAHDPEAFQLIAESALQATSNRLIQGEVADEVHVKISDFILNNYRKKRLFLTPDHPSIHLYRHVVLKLAKLGGFSIDPSFLSSAIEPQPRAMTPILPGVARALGLKFDASDWRQEQFLPGSDYKLTEYLASCFPTADVFLAVAQAPTRIEVVTPARPDGHPLQIPVDPGRRLMIQRTSAKDPTHTRVKVLGEHGLTEFNGRPVKINPDHWIFHRATFDAPENPQAIG
ncbi:WcbI family polysaccharide biosynthesis putative acetyltransferase [Ideonella sp.]|uniref:WcbI family polysaccharide biosynthesis putative acetyltransferase n=1 Tax=Ideonella sp. TaxID=1929293 RepID=UPI003BB58275